jgi:hypothetical protein
MVSTIMDARNIFSSWMNSITLEPIVPYPFHDNYPMVFSSITCYFVFKFDVLTLSVNENFTTNHVQD